MSSKSSASGKAPTEDEIVISLIEDYLDRLIAHKPIVLRFTAAAIAGYHGVETSYISWGLQQYRKAQGGRIKKVTAKYTVGTYNRGAGSEWFIFTWPGMTKAQEELGGEMLVIHEINSVVREDVKPMLKNIDVQFSEAVRRRLSVNRGFVKVNAGKLDSYSMMLMRFRADVKKIRPMAMRSVARSMIHILDKCLSDIDGAKVRVDALTNGSRGSGPTTP